MGSPFGFSGAPEAALVETLDLGGVALQAYAAPHLERRCELAGLDRQLTWQERVAKDALIAAELLVRPPDRPGNLTRDLLVVEAAALALGGVDDEERDQERPAVTGDERLGHQRVGGERPLDPSGCDVLAARGDDQVPGAADDAQRAVAPHLA